MKQNSAGGFAFGLDDWKRLDRFLILGSDAPTYYTDAKALTVDNAEVVRRCARADGIQTVRKIVEISEAGRAPKNEPALFALAICAKFGDGATKRAAYAAWDKVARIGTHLFHLNEYCHNAFGLSGKGYRQANQRWYQEKSPESLAYQVVKYQQRDGWSHRDILRLCKPKPQDNLHDAIYKWATKGEGETTLRGTIIEGYERAKRARSEGELIGYIQDFGLTREMVPTEYLNSTNVWAALLDKMPMTAMIRNLGKMSGVGLLSAFSDAERTVAGRLVDQELLSKARVHPLSVLSALQVYSQGHGMRGSLEWNPSRKVVDALDQAFYLSFGNVEPTGKNIMLALDVSGSMSGPELGGVPGITPRIATAALAMVTARTEENYVVTVFSDKGVTFGSGRSQWRGYNAGISSFDISPRERLDDILKKTSGLPFGGTDCALPMLYATKESLPIDAFVVLTDSETWSGEVHPSQALATYRQKSGRDAKMVVVGMTATEFSIADPSDVGSLDVVGMDTATPELISSFIRGEF